MTEQEIINRILADVESYRGVKYNIPRFYAYYYPQRLQHLSYLLRSHTLRECGNIKGYLELQQSIFDLAPAQATKFDKKLFDIVKWLDESKPTIFDSGDVVLFSLAYGDEYLSRMLNHSFRSLLANGNLPALCLECEDDVVFLIVTDEKGKSRIEAHETTARMKEIGVSFVYALMPDGLTDGLSEDLTYWLLGAAATLGLNYAKSIGAAFHHSYPDAIYSDKFFTEVLRLKSLGHQCILGQGMRSDESLLIPALAAYDNGDALSVPASDLVAHTLNSAHQVYFSIIVNNRPDIWLFPVNHVLIWEGVDYLHLNCPHLNAYWLSYESIKDLPNRFYMTFDSELDFVCKGESFYIPRENDDLYMGDISAPDRNPMRDVFGNMSETSMRIWDNIKFRDTLKFFTRGMRVKINRDIRPAPPSAMREFDIRAEKVTLFNVMMSCDPYRGQRSPRERVHDGKAFL